ncbi:MAG TPA: ATPase [Clostridiales bacterium]|nr:ATPase [Clostridiales bacterium]HCW52054.1 ATPase [Clostridiales bacterium]
MIREIAIGTGTALLIFLAVQGYNVMPVVFLGALLLVLLQSSGLSSLLGGGTRAGTVVDKVRTDGVTFDDIGGQASAKRELLEALEFITDRERVRRLGIRPLKGILLTGPPGTGKTLMAKAAARHTRSVFFSASGSEFIEVYAGVGAQRVRNLFTRAREAARREGTGSAIIFIDELEVLAGRRGQHTGHLEYDQTINQLLVEMDGLSSEDEVTVLVIGATNRFDLLDPAILRPGRFDRVVRVELPDREERGEILRIHTAGKPLADDVDLDEIARQTFGFSGSHLESVTNEAAILAFREGRVKISQAHLLEAVDKVMMGERVARRPQKDELERVAVHELGHALVAETVRPGSVSMVSISPRGGALGYVRQVPEADRFLYTREELLAQVDVTLAGCVAEEVFFGSRSTGARQDLDQALDLARLLVSGGMSELGIIHQDYVPSSQMHEVMTKIINEREARVREIISRHKALLEAARRVLLEKERLDGDEFRRLVGTMSRGRKGRRRRTKKSRRRDRRDSLRGNRAPARPDREHQCPVSGPDTGRAGR